MAEHASFEKLFTRVGLAANPWANPEGYEPPRYTCKPDPLPPAALEDGGEHDPEEAPWEAAAKAEEQVAEVSAYTEVMADAMAALRVDDDAAE